MEDVWLRYSFVSEEFLTVEEAREWVFCIAYFIQETTIVIKPRPPPVETKIIDVEDAIDVEDFSFKEKELERRVFKLLLAETI